jgi:hypothetical protein
VDAARCASTAVGGQHGSAHGVERELRQIADSVLDDDGMTSGIKDVRAGGGDVAARTNGTSRTRGTQIVL